jgi:ribosomal protein S18 acetylase RimI-like enzyme
VTVTIRTATPGDAAALTAIDRATWSVAVSPAPLPEPDAPFFGPRMTPADTLVAVVAGSAVGYVGFCHPTPLAASRHVIAVHGLAVAPGSQGRGIGRRLLDALTDEAVARGVRRITLRVLSPNAGARALYESCGFVTEGVLRGEFLLGGDLVDDVQMAREVGPTGSSAGS